MLLGKKVNDVVLVGIHCCDTGIKPLLGVVVRKFAGLEADGVTRGGMVFTHAGG